jgi:RNA polymerase sigma-70 factor (ECF subfamily)
MNPNKSLHHKADQWEGTALNETVFELFFKKNFPSLCTFCQYKFDLAPDAAKDIVHTSFIKLWQHRETVDTSRAMAFLLKTITNRALDDIKHENIKHRFAQAVKSSSTEMDHSYADELDVKELSEKIQLALNELPDQMKLIFELSRFEGLKYAEIAARLDISVKTVETQMSRALQKMRYKLADYVSTLFVIAFCFTFF